MSEEKAVEEQLKEAQQKLFEEVYIPAFVERLAEHGIVLDSQEKVAKALEFTANLKDLRDKLVKVQSEKVAEFLGEAVENVKQASAELG